MIKHIKLEKLDNNHPQPFMTESDLAGGVLLAEIWKWILLLLCDIKMKIYILTAKV